MINQSLVSEITNFRDEVAEAYKTLEIDRKNHEVDQLTQASQQPDFWDDPTKAQQIMKRLAGIKASIKPWLELKEKADELTEMTNVADGSMEDEIHSHLEDYKVTYSSLKRDLLFSGPYDDHDAILNLYAGAGGTDAQDWAEMLQRMYTRWAEANEMNISLLEQSRGDEAGIKSTTLQIEGPHVYGKLKGEHGVHRLVRQSPFNSDNLRQTSFAKVEVLPVIDEPGELELDENDVRIDVYRAGGHGGQSVNTTDSAVRVTHTPTGITVSIQNERSQLQNKETALTILRSKLAQLQIEQHQEKISELKGPNQSAEWGNQIRNYVLHPYKQVKDVRTKQENPNPDEVLDGKIDDFINAYLEQHLSM